MASPAKLKMKRHLETRYPDRVHKSVWLFQRKGTELLVQKTAIHVQDTLPTNALAASYKVAQSAKATPTVSETLILPVAFVMTSASALK